MCLTLLGVSCRWQDLFTHLATSGRGRPRQKTQNLGQKCCKTGFLQNLIHILQQLNVILLNQQEFTSLSSHLGHFGPEFAPHLHAVSKNGNLSMTTTSQHKLVGGFNPFENISQIRSFVQGWKLKKNIWNHLVMDCRLYLSKIYPWSYISLSQLPPIPFSAYGACVVVCAAVMPSRRGSCHWDTRGLQLSKKGTITLPETNKIGRARKDPKDRIPSIHFQVLCHVSFREGINICTSKMTEPFLWHGPR